MNGKIYHSVSHVAERQTVRDDNRDFVPPDEMIAALIADNLHIAEQQRAAVGICERSAARLADEQFSARTFSTKPKGGSGFSTKSVAAGETSFNLNF